MGKLGNWIKGTGSYEVKEIAGISETGELVTNGDFAGWTADDPDDWSVGGGEDANGYITEGSNGGCRIVRVSSSIYIYQECFEIGKHYRCIINITEDNGGQIHAQNGLGLIYQSMNEVGVYDFYFTATAVNQLYITADNGTDITVGNISVQEVPEGYPLLDVGTKYLECTSAGTIALPSTQAYGTWEFDLFKGADGNQTDVLFIQTAFEGANESYGLRVNMSEALNIIEGSTGVITTDNSYISINTWYSCKITRTKEGEFTYYIKGGSFGSDNWTLVNPKTGDTNPATDNTHTESKYIVLDLDDGDKIANIKIYNDVRQ